MKVLIDDQAFVRHGRSGISRYFSELIREFRSDPALAVDPITPYRFVANRHLTEMAPKRYRRVPLPPRVRPGVLNAANTLTARRRREPVDLVHRTLYGDLSRDSQFGVRQVCTVYDFTLEFYAELFPGWEPLLEDKQVALDRCDGLLCISQTTYNDLKKVHPTLDKPVEITPLGVAERFFDEPRRPVAGMPAHYLLHVGNRHVTKNVEVLLQAFSELAGVHPDLDLVLCGSPLTEAERTRLSDLGIESRTHHARVSDDDLPGLYAHAAAFVFPSRYEGFGLPVAEAMAAGCPVLVAEVPALVEVSDGAALTFHPDDPSRLTELLEDVLGDPALRARLVDAGRARARELSWRRTAIATAEAYRRIARA